MTDRYGEIKVLHGKLKRRDFANNYIVDYECDYLEFPTIFWKEIYQYIPIHYQTPFTRYFIHTYIYHESQINGTLQILLFDNYGQRYICKGIHRERAVMNQMLHKEFGFIVKQDDIKYKNPISKEIIQFIKSLKSHDIFESFDALIDMDSIIKGLAYQKRVLEKENKYLIQQNFKHELYYLKGKTLIFNDTELYDCYGCNINIIIESDATEELTVEEEEKLEKKYSEYKVVGSWDNWAKEYDLEFISDVFDIWHIFLDFIPPEGIYRYKLKKGDEWIEPKETELREKDEAGNWNNLITLHYAE